MERMIRSSCNTSTNRLMTLVSKNAGNRGPGDVERVLKQNGPDIFQDIRIVEQIPAGGRTYRNLASAGDYHRFLAAFWRSQLPYSDEMRALLSLSNRDRIVDGVDSMPDNVRVYDKTGSTSMLCGDMGIVDNRATERSRNTWPGSMPVERILARGNAVANACCGDIAPDRPDVFNHGVFTAYFKKGDVPAPDEWGVLAAWAWGMSSSMSPVATMR